MSLSWTQPHPTDCADAYLDFAWDLRKRRDPPLGAELAEPVFVRLKGDARPARGTLKSIVEDPASPLAMEPHELSVLTARCGLDDPDEGLPDEYALYRALGSDPALFDDLFDVIDTGMPVALSTAAADDTGSDERAAAVAKPRSGQPIVALIDDGIGFLNARFQKNGLTRFHAVWLQALERSAGHGVMMGQVLSAAQIDAMLAAGHRLDEPSHYTRINAGLIREEAHRSTERAFSHGTHILDLAAGADPQNAADAARDWPLLAVQLPPQAIEDTSGTRFESYIVQAVRWVLRRAYEIDPQAPVIVNLSLGMLAGPKDGTRFAEWQIAREAANWERIKKQPVRVVWSFGNDFESRLVARFDWAQAKARDDAERQVGWQVQASDMTESFVEIRCDKGGSLDGLEIALDLPNGGPGSGFVGLAPGEAITLERDGVPVARIYHVPERRLDDETLSAAHIVMALAPTESTLGDTLAPAGRYGLRCRHSGPQALALNLQIQRDDSLVGYRARARQSYFDDPRGYGWNPRYQDNSQLGPDCPIRHDGSHNALASVTGPQVFTAGAAWLDAASGKIRPSDYTSKGGAWCARQPSAATVADRSRIRLGVMATGTLSGTAAPLNGTSAAAGRMSRVLALGKGTLGAGGVPTRPVDPDDQDRLGDCVYDPPVRIPSQMPDF